MERRLARIFRKATKPLIAMTHVPALLGTPLYDSACDLEVGGWTWNRVDPERVERFVRATRGG